MAEVRKKSHRILLSVHGKNTRIDLFESTQWKQAEGEEGLYRVWVDGKWHSPAGKYTFLTTDKVGELCASILSGASLSADSVTTPQLCKGQEVRVEYGEIVDGIPIQTGRGIIMDEPQLSPLDGRWYVEVRISGVGWRFVLADNVRPWRQ